MNKDGPIKNKDTRVVTRLNVDFRFFRRPRADTSVVRGEIFRNSNLFKQLCMSSIPARMKKIESKKKALDRPQHFSHYKSMSIFPDAQGQRS